MKPAAPPELPDAELLLDDCGKPPVTPVLPVLVVELDVSGLFVPFAELPVFDKPVLAGKALVSPEMMERKVCASFTASAFLR